MLGGVPCLLGARHGADTRALCDEAAVELPPAVVPGWADKTAAAGWADVISTEEACSWSILEDIIVRAVVRVPASV